MHPQPFVLANPASLPATKINANSRTFSDKDVSLALAITARHCHHAAELALRTSTNQLIKSFAAKGNR